MNSNDQAVGKAIGFELRCARKSAGLTRDDLAARLPSKLHPQSLASYERGARLCTIARFVEICRSIGVSATELLGCALQRAEADTQTIRVDLQAVMQDRRAELLPLRRWARKRLDNDPDGYGIAHLDWNVVTQMATVFDIPRSEFVRYLISFTPRPAARRALADE